jgi:murein DD-endopeptidase MepM/ murein hydrolase activator NlpD
MMRRGEMVNTRGQGTRSDPLTEWFKFERLEYERLDERWAVVRLLATLDCGRDAPAGTALVVQHEDVATTHKAFYTVTHDSHTGGEKRSPPGLLWRVSFGVPVEAVEFQHALFKLTAEGGLALALPAPARRGALEVPALEILAPGSDAIEARLWTRHVRRHLTALATGVAVAAASGPAVSVAAADTVASTTSAPASADTTTPPAAVTPASVVTPTPDPKPPAPTPDPKAPVSTTSSTSTAPPVDAGNTHPATISTPAGANPPAAKSPTVVKPPKPAGAPTSETPTLQCKAPTILLSKLLLEEHRAPQPPGAAPKCVLRPAANKPKHKKAATKHKQKHKTAHSKAGAKAPSASDHGTATPTHRTGGAAVAPRVVTHPNADRDDTTTAGGAAGAADTSALGVPSPSAYLDPFTAAQIAHFRSVVANVDQPPRFLIPIYKAAGRRYHVPWQILAAINAIETDYGRNLNISTAGAEGWMQFMPTTWMAYGVAADGHGLPNPYNPRDAIFSAARYLAANGAPKHLRRAIFAYNHALWYVDAVLWRGQTITDHGLSKKLRGRIGYALPLDARYMRTFGRTDDGLDLETAPDGAAVYSITPGVITAVASDPSGFGPNYPVVLVTKGPLAGQYIYYGHVAASLVHVGQHVRAGQPIAVMGHTGDAASLGHGHIEIGFSDASGDPLNHHMATAWTPSGDAMRRFLVQVTRAFRVKSR